MPAARLSRPAPDEFGGGFANYVPLVPEAPIQDALERQLNELLTLLQPLSEADAMIVHPPYTWTIKEVIGHITDCERIFAYRALRAARGDVTPLPSFDENEYARHVHFSTFPHQELLRELEHVRRANMSLFQHLDDDAWLRRGTAGGVPMSVRAWAYVIVGHADTTWKSCADVCRSPESSPDRQLTTDYRLLAAVLTVPPSRHDQNPPHQRQLGQFGFAVMHPHRGRLGTHFLHQLLLGGDASFEDGSLAPLPVGSLVKHFHLESGFLQQWAVILHAKRLVEFPGGEHKSCAGLEDARRFAHRARLIGHQEQGVDAHRAVETGCRATGGRDIARFELRFAVHAEGGYALLRGVDRHGRDVDSQ